MVETRSIVGIYRGIESEPRVCQVVRDGFRPSTVCYSRGGGGGGVNGGRPFWGSPRGKKINSHILVGEPLLFRVPYLEIGSMCKYVCESVPFAGSHLEICIHQPRSGGFPIQSYFPSVSWISCLSPFCHSLPLEAQENTTKRCLRRPLERLYQRRDSPLTQAPLPPVSTRRTGQNN